MNDLTINDLSVCVVEPSHTQLKIIESRLKELDVKNITAFSTGIEAIEGLEDYQPDLVISSMYLPDITGTDIVLSMRDNDKLQDIPFMLISSETSWDILEPVRQAGVIAILPKPFATHDLKRALYSTVDYINPDPGTIADLDLEELSVLVVDDSPLARKFIKNVLKNIGIEKITEARDGTEAIKLIDKEFYDLILTDYNMPKMDGEKLTHYVRENSSQSAVPIIMVTSEGDQKRLAAVKQAGVSGICDKPFEIESVKTLLKNVLAE